MFKTIKSFNFKNKRVLVRYDFNVPLGEKGDILDDFRIRTAIPTIEYLVKKGAKVILMSHLGRPDGKVVENLRLTPVQDKLLEYLDISITKADDCIGKKIENWTRQMKPGEILLLENLRFHKEEEENDPEFSRQLSRLGDIFINDAFAVSHRSHASVVGITAYLPSGAGLLLEKEIKVLKDLMENPRKPLVALIGGVKIETKVPVIDKLSESAEWILINDVLANEIKEKNIRLKKPEKVVLPAGDSPGGGKDIGPLTVKNFKEKIATAKTIFWNGPLGLIEQKEFSHGSEEIAKAITASGAFSVVGGGETVEFINRLGLTEKFGYVSTGGGAMLEFLSGAKLPGIKALEK